METIKTKDYINQERMEAIKQIQANDDILKVRLYNRNEGRQ